MSNYDDPELRYSCLSEPIQELCHHPHSLTLIVTLFWSQVKHHTKKQQVRISGRDETHCLVDFSKY